jgi:hypothetical protein
MEEREREREREAWCVCFFLFKRRDKVNGCFWGGKKEEFLRQRSHVCENEKEVRLSKSILRERER